jgi:hypothetical protein
MKANTKHSSIKLSKNDIIFYYQPFKFPTDLISQTASKIGDLVFSLDSLEPDCVAQSTKKKIKLSACFIIEDELESKKGFVKKGKVNAPFKSKIENQFWRKAEPEDPGFFDNFRGRSDESKVITFKRNLELVEKRELSISFEKSVLLDHLEIQDQEFFGVKKKEGKDKQKNFPLGKNSEIMQNKENKDKDSNNIEYVQQTKEITATADDLFSEQGIFSNLGALVIGNYNTQNDFYLYFLII